VEGSPKPLSFGQALMRGYCACLQQSQGSHFQTGFGAQGDTAKVARMSFGCAGFAPFLVPLQLKNRMTLRSFLT
jgi:hypothetical protein